MYILGQVVAAWHVLKGPSGRRSLRYLAMGADHEAEAASCAAQYPRGSLRFSFLFALALCVFVFLVQSWRLSGVAHCGLVESK
jgi:hypothetical protein